MNRISLTKGKYTLVDDEDFEYLNQWKWYFSAHGYAVRSQHIKLSVGKYTTRVIRMHRVINNTPNGLITDHINRNKLDNRKINLRNADKSLNGLNRGRPSNNKSGHKGVYWDSENNKWRAELKIKGKKMSLGRFVAINDAILARTKAEHKYYVI